MRTAGQTMIIGIAGGTGSGKTTVTRKIKEYFGEFVVALIVVIDRKSVG
mgnify:CR=1 FL=1